LLNLLMQPRQHVHPVATRVTSVPSNPFGAAWPSFAVFAIAAGNAVSMKPKSTSAIPWARPTFVWFVARG
jgi:hypothetical protein